MRAKIHPAGLVLVGCLLICTFSVPGLAGLQPAYGWSGTSGDPFIDISDQKSDEWGVIKSDDAAVYFPWYGRKSMTMPTARSSPACSSASKKEQIQLNSSHSVARVDDLTAVNCERQLDIYYNASVPQAGGELAGLANSLDIRVLGGDEDAADGGMLDENATKLLLPDMSEDISEDASREVQFHRHGIQAGNYLNVDVRDITVSAINTMEGGSAVATSNIIIEPVQIIVCPSEVNAKLK